MRSLLPIPTSLPSHPRHHPTSWRALPAAAMLVLACSAMWGSDIAPAITLQPASQTVLVGNTATFSVAATGTPAPTYQWYQRTSTWVPGTYVWNQWGGYYTSGYTSTSNVPIAQATGSSYSTAATQLASTGATYFVVVTSPAGTSTSNAVTLTVASPVSITTQPANQTATLGTKATFSAIASSTIAITYQWFRNGSAISGATAASYTTPAVMLADDGATYSVTASNAVSSATSQVVTLRINAPPAITTQPMDQSVVLGSSVTFSVTATGIPPPSYQWRRAGTSIPGATSPNYSLTSTTKTDDHAVFSVLVSNSSGSALSQNATLTLTYPPTITTQPSGLTVAVGNTATFSVAATVTAGTPAPTYQWCRGGVDIAGATAASYTTPATVVADNGANFSVKVSNAIGTVSSKIVSLVVTGSGPIPMTGNDVFFVMNKQGAVISKLWGGSGDLSVEGSLNANAMRTPLLNVDGVLHAQEVHAAHLLIQANWWGDLVFAPDYRLMPLDEVQRFIKANRHLPAVPDEAAIKRGGIQVNDMLATQMMKIEELTLHIISQQEIIQRQETAMARMQARLDRLEQTVSVPLDQAR